MIDEISIEIECTAVCDSCCKSVSLSKADLETYSIDAIEYDFNVDKIANEFMVEEMFWTMHETEGLVCPRCAGYFERVKDDPRTPWSDGRPLFPEDPPKKQIDYDRLEL